MAESLEQHYDRVAQNILEGRVVPFLGAGVNLCGRPTGCSWTESERSRLPDGRELAAFLAEKFKYPAQANGHPAELVRVSQYVVVMEGLGDLYDKLHELFDVDYEPGPLHRFLAGLPPALRASGASHQLVVTTNYDDALERSFARAGEECDVVSYIAKDEHAGKFWHHGPGRDEVIETPNDYKGLNLRQRTVILKIHGAIDRKYPDGERDSFVITEDDYIDYLARTDVSSLVPMTLLAAMRRSHLLFLGYGLRDWNLRVILRRLWSRETTKYKSWAIQLDPDPLEAEFWKKHDVEILDVRLEEYVERLGERLSALQGATAA